MTAAQTPDRQDFRETGGCCSADKPCHPSSLSKTKLVGSAQEAFQTIHEILAHSAQNKANPSVYTTCFFMSIQEQVIYTNTCSFRPMKRIKTIVFVDFFWCRSSMQKFCTSTVWYRPTKQNDVCSFHAMPFPVPFVYKKLHKHILFPAHQLSKTKGLPNLATQCPTGPIGSNLSKPAALGHGSPCFKGSEAGVPTLGTKA